jgi:MerR family mercuric resistance operon transcriptional regulator
MRLAGAKRNNVRSEVRSLVRAHVADIQSKIADLQAMERVLSDAICECETGQQPYCPLIEVLSRN